MGIYASIIKAPHGIFKKRGLFYIEPPIQVGWWFLFWCNSGAIGMERMDFVLIMDNFWSIPLRVRTLRHDLWSQGRLFPHGKGIQLPRPIRNQEFILSGN
jgi:hypothetical protein